MTSLRKSLCILTALACISFLASCGDARYVSSREQASVSENAQSGYGSQAAGDSSANAGSDSAGADSSAISTSLAAKSGKTESGTAGSSSSPQTPGEEKKTLEPLDYMGSKLVKRLSKDTATLNAMLASSILKQGNPARIAAAMKKAKAGKTVKIAAIGGSITEGFFASAKSKSYSYLVYEWWKSVFKNADMRYYNYGIAATGSILGAHRAGEMLAEHPDLVLIDFSVNDFDPDKEAVKECYESLVRRILADENSPGIILVAFTHTNRVNTQDTHKLVADRYNLPFISFHNAFWKMKDEGKTTWNSMFTDVVHPNDEGHQFAADLIVYKLVSVYNSLTDKAPVIPALPEPLTKLRYMSGRILGNGDIAPVDGKSWSANNSAYGFDCIKRGWNITSDGGFMEFELTTKTLYLCYSNAADKAEVSVTVDGAAVAMPSKDGSAVKWTKLYEGDTAVKRRVRISVTSGNSYLIYGLLVS